MTTPAAPPVVFLAGPTAAGKTALAVELVADLPLDIVSVDSAMVYRRLDIGTGKPSAEVLARAPHRLVDVCDPDRAYSAAEFRDDARREIEAIRARGRVPLLVGGTGLYFRALERGLARLPPADPALRARLAEEARAGGWAALHARLARVDAPAAARIHPHDPQRIQRALEVFELTGRPISAWHAGDRGDGLAVPVIRVVVGPTERGALHRAIEARFRRMVAAGLVAEVRALRRRFRLDPGMPSMRAVGYRQAWQHLEGRLDHDALIERGIVATRQLARRQLTWLRGEEAALHVDGYAPGAAARLRAWLRGRIGAGG